MIASRKFTVGFGLLLAAGLLSVGCSFLALRKNQERAMKAKAELIQCQSLAARIIALNDRPAVAGPTELLANEITQKIEQAAQKAQIDANQIVRIWPEPTRRIGNSVYKEKNTRVLLRHVTLPQLLPFLHAFNASDAALRVMSARISAPRDQQVGDLWILEATLTQLVYDPPSPELRKGGS